MNHKTVINNYLESLALLEAYNRKDVTEEYIIASVITSLSELCLHTESTNNQMVDGLQHCENMLNIIIDRFYQGQTIAESIFRHQNYYNLGKIETIDYIAQLGIVKEFCLGNSIKYLSRYKHKEKPFQDLTKGKEYVLLLIKYYEDLIEKENVPRETIA